VQSGILKKEEICLLIGEYEHSLDEKGRLIMPAKLKDDIGEKFVITKGLDGCLFVYSQKEWKLFEDKLRTFPLTNKDARALMRFFLAGAIQAEIDKQGRFLITSNLREFAELEKEIIIIGVLTKIEIWSKEKWIKYSKKENKTADEIAEKMSNLGI
jgi:MraZ protein